MPKIIDHDQRRLEIVESTLQLMVAGGFQAATMREIAAAAGFANGALKRYFEGKDDILLATSKHVSAVLIRRLEQCVDGLRGMDALTALIEETMPDRQGNQDTARVLFTFWERAVSSPDLQESFREDLAPWRRMIEKFLHQAAELGQLASQLPPAAIADELLTLTVGGHMMARINPGPEYSQGQAAHLRRRLAELRLAVPSEVGLN